ncbi:Uma2 family endonuclease [candidate division KSB1 bacterium]|nr:Uma2 family endonuclease [candidate division KSB1 bacterium]
MAAVVEREAALDEERLFVEFPAPTQSPPPSGKLTFEQANKVAGGASFELIHGKIILKAADDKHADAHALLCGLLGKYFKTKPIGRVRLSFTLCLWPDNPYEAHTPDLSVILNENLTEERYGSRAPDLAIEIFSRDDDWSALFEKAKLYLEKGSRIVWIVDPFQKGVMVITSNDRHWVTDTLTCPELLLGFSVNVQDIFSWPAAPTTATE